jgi:uncharacterized protein involved in tolerance to divalent cations
MNDDFDFGFTAVSEEEYNSIMNKTVDQTADTYRNRLTQIEKIVIPFLQKLMETGDKEYIHWPNRKPIIEKQIERILKLTRD